MESRNLLRAPNGPQHTGELARNLRIIRDNILRQESLPNPADCVVVEVVWGEFTSGLNYLVSG